MFDTSGRVGLGTTTPGAKVHVVGTQGSVGAGSFQLDTPTLFSNWTGAYPALEMVNTNLTNNNISLFQFADAPSGAAHAGIGAVNTSHTNKYGDLFFFTKQSDGYQMRMGIFGGNVGIGTTAPGAKLHVAGNVNFTGLRTQVAIVPNIIGGLSANAVGPGVYGATIGGGGGSFANNVTGHLGTVGGGDGNTAGGYGAVAGGQYNGAVGIAATVGGGWGNRAEGQYSTVGGGSQNTASGFNSTVPGGSNNTAQGNFSLGAGHRAEALHSGSFVWSDSTLEYPNSFSSTADNQFLINATGGVGIGTNAPSARLHVAGVSSALDVPIAILQSSGNQVPLSFRTAAAERARIRSDINGNFVFATLTGAERNIHFRAGDDINTDMLIDASSGSVTISGALTVTSCTGCSPPSDRNLKANFSPANPRFILNRLASIPIQTWNYKNEPTAVRHIGPMAQDFRAAFGYGTDDKSLNTVDANGVTMAAIQGLYQQNQELKGVVTQLRARLTQLERRMPKRRTVRTRAKTAAGKETMRKRMENG